MKIGLESLPMSIQSTVLRLFSEADLPQFHVYRSDPDLARYQGWTVMTEREALDFIREMATIKALQPGKWVQLAVADEASDSLLGDVGLFVDNTQEEAQVGFTLSRIGQGAGHATRAVRAALTLVFGATSVIRVSAATDARNTKSIHVLERVGFCKVREQKATYKGEECLELIYMLQRGNQERV